MILCQLPRRRLSFVSFLLAAATAAPPALAAVQPLTLYEKTGRAPLVVWGEVPDGTHRFAIIQTREVIRCTIPERPGDTFRIAFRLDSFLREPWQDSITFANGEHVLLFLRKFTKEDGRQPEGDVYTLMWGAQGKEVLPPEGEAARVAATKRFASILSRPSAEQPDQIKAALSDENPVISDGAFEQALKEGIGDLEMMPQLTGLLGSPRDPPRVQSLRMIAQIVSDARVAGREIPHPDELSQLLRGRAVTDPSEPVRVQAIAALSQL